MIPVDEMLGDLRYALEAFALSPSPDTFGAVQNETRRIKRVCEDALVGDDGDD